MSNSFEILMNQLGMPAEMRQAPALAQADIERVVVHKISKVWEFHFVFSNILPIEIFLELKKGLCEEFSKTGNKAHFSLCKGIFVPGHNLRQMRKIMIKTGVIKLANGS